MASGNLNIINNLIVKQTETNLLSQRLLNMLEIVIMDYGRKNKYIDCPFKWFSQQLGYKHANYLYDIFKERNHSKLGLKDLKMVLAITKDQRLLDYAIQELQEAIL